MSTSPLLYRTSKSTTLLFLSSEYIIIYLSSKEVRAKKTIYLPPKEEGVFLEILDKSMWRYFNLLQSEWGKIRKRGDLKPHFVMILLNNGEIRQIFFRVPNELSTW